MNTDRNLCPRCGNNRAYFERWLNGEGTSYTVYYRLTCTKCGFAPDHWEEGIKETIEYWNSIGKALNSRINKLEEQLHKYNYIKKEHRATIKRRYKCQN